MGEPCVWGEGGGRGGGWEGGGEIVHQMARRGFVVLVFVVVVVVDVRVNTDQQNHCQVYSCSCK